MRAPRREDYPRDGVRKVSDHLPLLTMPTQTNMSYRCQLPPSHSSTVRPYDPVDAYLPTPLWSVLRTRRSSMAMRSPTDRNKLTKAYLPHRLDVMSQRISMSMLGAHQMCTQEQS